MTNRYTVRRQRADLEQASGMIVGPLVAGIVGGLAWAAGAEAWSWISPMRRKEQRDLENLEQSSFEEFEDVEIE